MRDRLTITLTRALLTKLDGAIDGVKIRNRSHAIEFFLNKAFYNSHVQAVVLAGGVGTRMRPFTYEMSKAMLPIKNKPLLEYSVLQLKNAGITDLIICINEATGDKIKEYFGDGNRFGVRIQYSVEKNNLGTGGAVKAAEKLVKNEQFIIMYSDIVSEIDLQEFLAFHEQSNSYVTLALKSVQEVRSYGQIELKGTRITKMNTTHSNLVNAGIYLCNRDLFSEMPANKSFLLDDVIAQLIKTKLINGYVFDGKWIDVGTPGDYEKALHMI